MKTQLAINTLVDELSKLSDAELRQVDIHTRMGQLLFDRNEITKEERDAAKRLVMVMHYSVQLFQEDDE